MRNVTAVDQLCMVNCSRDGGGLYNAGVLTLDHSAVLSNTSTEPADGGGGIYNSQGTLTVTHSLVAGNQVLVSGRGGGIDSAYGSVALVNSTVSANTATDFGGGLVNGGTLTLLDSSVISNTAASGWGGGLGNLAGSTTLVNSTLSGNRADRGGGIANNNATLTLVNSTVSGNDANTDGGGIVNDCPCTSTVSLYNVTIANNQADADFNGSGSGGGLWNGSDARDTVYFQNSLVAGNYATRFFLAVYVRRPDDCYGALDSLSYNLIGTLTSDCSTHNTAPPDQYNVNPQLGPLAPNGGSTETHALLAGSPAIDAANPAGCTDNLGATLTTDQRGARRPTGGCDVGAYEYGAQPSLRLLNPSARALNSPAFVLSLEGSDFISGASARWNGSALATTFVSATQLTAPVPAGDLTATGTFSLSVQNPGPGDGVSSALPFTVKAPLYLPLIQR